MPQPIPPQSDSLPPNMPPPDGPSEGREGAEQILMPPDPHASAARCHQMAAQMHYEAAKHHADGEHGKAGHCAMKAKEHGERAAHHAEMCCRYHTSGIGTI